MRVRYWAEMLVLASVAAFGLAISLGSHTAAAGPSAPSAAAVPATPAPAVASATYEGIVSDTHCGAKHSAKGDLAAADCTRACVHSGEHFALIDAENAYILAGEPDQLKRLAGERVKIAGTLNGNTIEVASVTEITPKAE
jgi:hypothetical protein